jgi:hypothetical protein
MRSFMITRVSKWTVRWVEQVAYVGAKRKAYEVWLEDLKERAHLEDPGIAGKIILK